MSVWPYIVLWKWRHPTFRTKYHAANVNSLVHQMLRQGMPLNRIILLTDDPEGVICPTAPVWDDHAALRNISGGHLPSCYRRLRIFDPETLQQIGIPLGERVVSLDLDAVIVQDFKKLFMRDEQFVGWYVPGHRHRIVLNGSMFMFTAGELGWLWKDFDPRTSPMMASAAGYMGSDQGYLSHQIFTKRGSMVNAGGWTAAEDGVLSFTRDIRQTRRLPRSTRIIFFAGKQKPWDHAVIQQNSWITRYTNPPRTVEAAAPRIEAMEATAP